MPRIEEYTAQNIALRPSETGIESLAGAGRRAGAFYNQGAETLRAGAQDEARAAEAKAQSVALEGRAGVDIAKSLGEAADQGEQYVAHQEITHAAQSIAQSTSDALSSWNGIVSDPKTDPNDTSLAAKFREEQLEPMFDRWREAAQTPQAQYFVEQHIEQVRSHFFEKQTADMANLAGIAVKTGLAQTTNAWANSARSDPHLVDALVKDGGLIDSTIAGVIGSSPNLKGIDAAKLHADVAYEAKVEAVHSAALGAIESSGNPDAAAAEITKRYPQFIKPQEADQLAKAAKVYRSAAQGDYERARRLQKERAEDKSEAQRDKYIQDIFGDNSQTDMRQVLRDPNLVPKDREHLIGILRNEGKTRVSDPPTRDGLIKGTFNVDNPTTLEDVMKAHASGKLNDQDFTRTYNFVKLSQEAPVQEPIFKASMQGATKLLGTDAIGSEKHAQFMAAFLPEYLKQYRAGTMPPNALDLNDDKSLIRQAMKPYMRSPQDMMRDRVMERVGGANPFDTESWGSSAPSPVPPAGQREAGKVYPTPVGPMKWTGTGWVKP